MRRIVVDPGHGGKDPGAVGAHGTEEKAINLLVAQHSPRPCARRIIMKCCSRAPTTRSFPWPNARGWRTAQNADLFVSVHCNASLSSKLKGFEVYFLSETRVRSACGRRRPTRKRAARLWKASRRLLPDQVRRCCARWLKTANINDASVLGVADRSDVAGGLSEPSLGG